MRRLTYALPLLLFVPALLAMTRGGAWTWFLPVFTFVLLPLGEQLSEGSGANVDGDAEAELRDDPVYDWLLWAVVPAQLTLLGAFLWRLSSASLAPWELAGTVATMGIACGAYGINVAHELGHRRTRHEQAMAKVLLTTSLYRHFFVEHNRGHHRRVATPDDPASSREGETVYAFWWRSVTGGLRSAWGLERDRVARLGLPAWSWSNEIVRDLAVQAAVVVAIGVVFGPAALAGFLVAATIGFLLLETVNYVEHYGLQRTRTDRGAFERVQPHHSWNSNRPGGRVILYELTRHSDHHAHATRPYQVLRHHAGAPQLPAGYPALILAALVPPLFFRVMAPPLAAWRARHGSAAAA